MKLREHSISISVHTAGRRKARLFPIHKLNVKNVFKKRIEWGMSNKRHAHKDRLVVNSAQDTRMVNELLGLSLKQCFKNFKLGIARSSKKDHRSYAQVVSGKGDSAYSLQHKVHSNTDAQYSTSTHSLLEGKYRNVHLAGNNSMPTNRGSNKGSTVCPDPVIQSHSRITPPQKQVSGSSQVKRQAVTNIDNENMPISIQTDSKYGRMSLRSVWNLTVSNHILCVDL